MTELGCVLLEGSQLLLLKWRGPKLRPARASRGGGLALLYLFRERQYKTLGPSALSARIGCALVCLARDIL